jgi:hypothetical protein
MTFTAQYRNEPELLTTDQAAELLQVHPITLVLWRRENRGPPFIDATDARFIRYLRTDVSAWLEQNRRNTSPANASFLPVHKSSKKSKGGRHD